MPVYTTPEKLAAAWGFKLPKPLIEQRAIRTAVMGRTVWDPGVEEAALNAGLRNRTFTAAAAVAAITALGQTAAARAALRPQAQMIDAALNYAERAALLEVADELTALLRPFVDRFGTELGEAIAIVGAHPDSVLIGRLGAAAGEAWASFQRAHDALMSAKLTLLAVFEARRIEAVDIPQATWVPLAELPDADAVARLSYIEKGFPALIEAGHTITLNDHRAVVAHLHEVHTAAAAVKATADRAALHERVSSGR